MDISDVVASEAKEQASLQPMLNVGKTLREAREAMGMSVHDVAERIKFAPRQVEALESNDFANLPKATFLRGFVRSYARVLQLDEAKLIAALPCAPAPQPVVNTPVVDVSFPGLLVLQRINLMWLAGALGVALVLGLFIWVGGSEPVQKPTEVVMEAVPLPATDAGVSAVTATQTLTQAVPVEPLKVAESRKVEEKPKVVEKPKAVEKMVEKVKAVEKAVTKPNATAPAQATTSESKPAVALELLKRRPLHFVFNGAAWIEVIDVNGDILLSRSNQGGTEKWIGGPRRAPYDVSIGNPGNVKLYYKGKEVDLSAYAGMETARIKVE